MQRLGKVLLGSTAAVALASSALTLSATQASAQINIEGLIRGAMSQYGGHYYRGRRRAHEVRHERHHAKRREAKDEGSGKDEHSGKEEHPGDNGDQANAKPDRRQFSSHPKDAPQDEASSSNPPPPSAPPPPQQTTSGGDVPNFTPEK